jgi:hypothetical protein
MTVLAPRAKLMLTAPGAGLAVALVIASAPASAASSSAAGAATRAAPGNAARTWPAGAARPGPLAEPTPAPNDPDVPDAHEWTDQVWAGWVDVGDQNVELRDVTANFNVPTVTCNGADEAAAFWVGLDGFGASTTPVTDNQTVEQVGIEVECVSTPSGYVPDYYSFWEIYPNNPNPIGYVNPGDGIAASVYYNDSTLKYNLTLSDSNTTSADINTFQGCTTIYICHNATAEVIAEDPGMGVSHGVYLADFGKVSFSQVGVTSRNGTHGTLEGNSLWSANEETMEYHGTLMAQPSDRSDSNTDFSVTWKNSG